MRAAHKHQREHQYAATPLYASDDEKIYELKA